MPGNCAIFRSWNSGDTLTASDLTTSFTTVGVTNMTPQCLDDYSATDVQMQTTTDPYPSSVISLSTSTAGELERIRFILKKLGGWSQWYAHTEAAATTQTRQHFTGLRLRTSPDRSVAKTTVSVLGLQSVVMSDGTGYVDVVVPGTDAPMTAAITASGASGLDTGTEQASTWYEAHLIGRSDTKAKSDLRLILHRAKDYLKDTSFEPADDIFRALRVATSTATDLLAQGFQVATAGKVEFIDAKLTFSAAPSGNVWFEIWSDNAGNPNALVATSDKLTADEIVAVGAVNTYRFAFRSPATLNASTQYHLVMNGDYAKSDTDFVGWRGLVAGGYASGSAKQYNGTTWSGATGVGDFWFKLYITRNNAAITFPTDYNQSCLLGYVYNNSGSDFEPFVQHNRRSRSLRSTTSANAIATGITSTTPALTSIATLVPPVPVELWAEGNQTAGGATGTVILAGYPEFTQGFSVKGAATATFTAASIVNPMGSILTEFQAAYVAVSSQTWSIFGTEFEF